MTTKIRSLLFSAMLILMSLARLHAQTSGIGMSLLIATPPPQYLYEWSSQPSAATLIVTNPGTSPVVARFQAELRRNGQLEAETKPEMMPMVTIAPGAHTFTGGEILPYEAIRFYGTVSTVVRTGTLPDGTYELCVHLYGPTGNELTPMPACNVFTIVRYDPPTLIAPTDHSVIQRQKLPGTMLIWTPQPPIASGPPHYLVRLVRQESHQSPTVALQTSRPVLERSVVGSTQLLLAFERTQSWDTGTYIWQVQTRDEQGTPIAQWSEPSTFTVIDENPVTPIDTMTSTARPTIVVTATTPGETGTALNRPAATAARSGPCPELEGWLNEEQTKLENLTTRRQALADSLVSVTDSLAGIYPTFATDSAQTAAVAKEYETAAKEYDAISEKIRALQGRRRELEGTYHKASYNDREKTIAALKELEKEMKELMEQSDHARERRHEIWERYKPLRDNLRELQESIRALERKSATLQRELSRLDQEIEWHTEYRNKAEQQMEDCRKQARETREKENETFARGLDLEGEVTAARRRIDSIRSAYAGREWPSEASHALADAERRLREAEKAIAETGAYLSDGKVDDAQRRSNNAREALTKMNGQIDGIPGAFAREEERQREQQRQEQMRKERERRLKEEQERLEQKQKEMEQSVDAAEWSIFGWKWVTVGGGDIQDWLDGRMEAAKEHQNEAAKAMKEARYDLQNGDLRSAEQHQNEAEEAMRRAKSAVDDINNILYPGATTSVGENETKEMAKEMLTGIFNTLGELSEHSSEADVMRVAGRILVIVDGIRSVLAVPCCVKEFLNLLGTEAASTSNPVGLHGAIQAIVANLKSCANLPSALTTVDLGAMKLADALSNMSSSSRKKFGDALKKAAQKMECRKR